MTDTKTTKRAGKYEPFDWYRTPLYYDMIFDEGTQDEADFIEAAAELYCANRRRGASALKIMEPACGSSRLVIELAKRGHTCSGFDLEPGMIEYSKKLLKKRGLKADLSVQDMTSFKYPRTKKFDVAHCVVSTFKYLIKEADARKHLELVAESLRPGGIYILGLHLTPEDQTGKLRERWTAHRGGEHVTCNIQSWPPDYRKRTEAIRSRLIVTPLKGSSPAGTCDPRWKVAETKETKYYESSWTFRTYNLKQLKSLIRSVPAFDHLATYDFNHDITYPIEFGSQLDNVLVLQKRQPPKAES
ncbi:dTDP-3-amino-3,6-dideoxy-alpha-D-glucopyranose N,N-dimethyltransferase [Poriferisphaera corsica]|uniref:dTDP-3-amino-3,6-dideoxy-alpha-D-glucopyranose N,N-dimethyltransferase n=1 Tax=Poriferisphaera corsica TaxID=2528020 RepID=A0A517YYB9_9BACT|nr:class I SAM-dependent methyltransferase [Poriferisphaera corsica]QDU35216.1 dTDP-3-amino-3,6-dideoxy-alpha-D-glucopyranose N,N-dimethyltransferase [Poriferisphaera corsica]